MTLARSRSCGISTTESMPGPGGVGGHRVGQVPGRGTGGDLEAQLAGLGQGDGHHPVLERAGRVGRVVLDPQLAEPELRGQPVGPDQGREARPEVHRGGVADRQQVGVAPDRPGPGLDPLTGDGGGHPLVVVGDLERPEAEVTHVERFRRIGTATFTTAQARNEIHSSLLIARALAPGAGDPVVGGRRRSGCRSVTGPGPSAALDDLSIVGRTPQACRQRGRCLPAGPVPLRSPACEARGDRLPGERR